MEAIRKNRQGFTLVELLVLVAILMILAALLLPALQRTLEHTRRVACLNTQKQLWLGITAYADDSNGYYPYHEYDLNDWFGSAMLLARAKLLACSGMTTLPLCPSLHPLSQVGYTHVWANYYIFPGGGFFGSGMSGLLLRRDKPWSKDVVYGGRTRNIPPDELLPFVSDPNRQSGSTVWRPAMHATRGNPLYPEGANAVFKDGHGEFRIYNPYDSMATPFNRYTGVSGTGPMSTRPWGIYSGRVYPLPKVGG